jgi:hypothetical protein
MLLSNLQLPLVVVCLEDDKLVRSQGVSGDIRRDVS